MVKAMALQNERELATVIAALRLWQDSAWVAPDRFYVIATNDGEFARLNADEIEALIYRIEHGDEV